MGRPPAKDAGVSARMRAQRERDTALEKRLRVLLFAAGYRYRVHYPVPGTRRTIDVAFIRRRVAVFVDGCFWHCCPEHGTLPGTNTEWWRAKLRTNVERDRNTDSRLRQAGWTVIRLWEHVPPEQGVARVIEALG